MLLALPVIASPGLRRLLLHHGAACPARRSAWAEGHHSVRSVPPEPPFGLGPGHILRRRAARARPGGRADRVRAGLEPTIRHEPGATRRRCLEHARQDPPTARRGEALHPGTGGCAPRAAAELDRSSAPRRDLALRRLGALNTPRRRAGRQCAWNLECFAELLLGDRPAPDARRRRWLVSWAKGLPNMPSRSAGRTLPPPPRGPPTSAARATVLGGCYARLACGRPWLASRCCVAASFRLNSGFIRLIAGGPVLNLAARVRVVACVVDVEGIVDAGLSAAVQHQSDRGEGVEPCWIPGRNPSSPRMPDPPASAPAGSAALISGLSVCCMVAWKGSSRPSRRADPTIRLVSTFSPMISALLARDCAAAEACACIRRLS